MTTTPGARRRMIAAMEKLFAAMVANGELALVTPDDATAKSLATGWAETGAMSNTLADWLIEQDVVDDVFVDADLLDARVKLRLRQAAEPTSGQREHLGATSAYEPTLAQAIFAAPDDLDARAVYADWLQEQGDPRGELMMLQIAPGKRTTKARAREKEILATHRRHFYGELAMEKEAGDARVRTVLVNGYFDKAIVPDEHALRKLLELESSRFLTSLAILCRTIEPIDTLLAKRRLPLGLRELKIAMPIDARGRPSRSYLRTTCLGDIDLGRALAELRYLERIEVHATRIRLDALASAKVKELILDADRLEIGPKALIGLQPVTLDLIAPRFDGPPDLAALVRARPA